MISPGYFPLRKAFLLLIISSLGYITLQGQEPDTSLYFPYYYRDAVSNNLLIAAVQGYDSEVERLISKGADVNFINPEGATSLFFAVAGNHSGTVKKLLAYEPEIDLKTAYGESPLNIAVKNGNIEIAEILIRAGADIDITDDNGASSLHYASLSGDFYVTDLLLYYRAEYDKKAADGTTPLMAAILTGYADIADLLIQHGANLEARDNKGFTPFLIAAQNGDTLLMNYLLDQGVDIYEKNADNSDALSLAISSNHVPAVKLLLKRGSKWMSENDNGSNPYHVAVTYGRKEIFSLLEQNRIPGKSRIRFNEFTVTPSIKFTNHDFYSGISITVREPLIKSGLIAGIDSKLWYTRVLMENNEDLYYQYMDKGSMFYAGIFKDFMLMNYSRNTGMGFYASLAGAYTFGNKLKGTGISPEEKFRIVPSAGLKLFIGNITVTGGIEYLKSEFYGIGPVWFRTGCSYTFFFNNVKAPPKRIRWN